MCGRYFIADEALEGYDIEALNRATANGVSDFQPGMEAPVIVADCEGVERMHWGFSREQGGLVINARVETMEEKPMFRGLVDGQRCAVPASGYYEWRRADKQKYAVDMRDSGRIWLAGLYRVGSRGKEFVVVTQPPLQAIQPIHNRMPLILPDKAAVDRWLRGDIPLFEDNGALRIAAEGPEQLQMTF